MDCINARVLLLFARPACTELGPEETDALHEHLEQCGDCRLLAHKEKQVDDAVGRALRQVPVPADLHEKILGRLADQHRPRPWTWLATAAALLIAVGFGVGWYTQQAPPRLDTAAVTGPRPGSSPEAVLTWFREQGLAVEAPPEFDFEYLNSCEVVSLQGRRVPKLLFLNGAAAAHVYVVSTSTFRMDEELQQDLVASSVNAEVHQYPEIGDFKFLVIYSPGGSRDSFPRRGV